MFLQPLLRTDALCHMTRHVWAIWVAAVLGQSGIADWPLVKFQIGVVFMAVFRWWYLGNEWTSPVLANRPVLHKTRWAGGQNADTRYLVIEPEPGLAGFPTTPVRLEPATVSFAPGPQWQPQGPKFQLTIRSHPASNGCLSRLTQQHCTRVGYFFTPPVLCG